MYKLADFGISGYTDAVGAGMNTCMGTPPQMAPEMFGGYGYTNAVDVFAWGGVVWQMATLRMLGAPWGSTVEPDPVTAF